MQVQIRDFDGRKILVLLPTEEESKLVDAALGSTGFDADGKGPEVTGNVCLADGYGEHYIRLERA